MLDPEDGGMLLLIEYIVGSDACDCVCGWIWVIWRRVIGVKREGCECEGI